MGFFDNIGDGLKNIGRVIGNPIGSGLDAIGIKVPDPLGDIYGSIRDGAIDMVTGGGPKEPDLPDVPGMDPKLKEIRDRQVAEAKKFRQNLPKYNHDQYSTALSKNRDALAKKMRQSTQDFSRRGLLNSGIKHAQQSDIVGQSMADLENERQDISSSLEKAAAQYDADALKAELGVNQAQADIQKTLYERALAERTSRQQNLSSLFGAAGNLGGLLAAKR